MTLGVSLLGSRRRARAPLTFNSKAWLSVVPTKFTPGEVPLLPPSFQRPVRPVPSPVKLLATLLSVSTPEKIWLALSSGTLALNRASAMVPVKLPAGRLSRPAPLPPKALAVTVAKTSGAVAGLFLLIPTKPAAGVGEWALGGEAKSAKAES